MTSAGNSEMTTDPDARRLLWFLFAGSRGGENRVRIIDLLKERPYNTNQLAEAMGLDYKAIQHHMGVLEKNSMVVRQGEKYGVLYFISNYLEHNIAAFEEVKAAIEKKKLDLEKSIKDKSAAFFIVKEKRKDICRS